MTYYYVVVTQVLLTANKPGLEEQVKQEINVFCHKLERLDGITHVFLKDNDVVCEGPEPRTAAGSLD